MLLLNLKEFFVDVGYIFQQIHFVLFNYFISFLCLKGMFCRVYTCRLTAISFSLKALLHCAQVSVAVFGNLGVIPTFFCWCCLCPL